MDDPTNVITAEWPRFEPKIKKMAQYFIHNVNRLSNMLFNWWANHNMFFYSKQKRKKN